MGNDWQAQITRARDRLSEPERERENAIEKLAHATSGVRREVLGHLDRKIVEQRSQIEVFEWAMNHNLD